MTTGTHKHTIKWDLDPAHSQLQFKVRHLMLTTVTGEFKDFKIHVETEGNDFSTANIHAVVKVPSVTTGNETRDTHLKSDDFFNAESFQELLFAGKSFKPVADNKWLLEGDITIRDITKPISFDVEYMGMMDDPWGNSKAGFEVNGIVSRKEFGLKWNVLTDTGGVVAGDEVKIHCNVQFIRQK